MPIHVFNRALLENLSEGKNALPFHLAHKAVPHLNEKGERVAPVKPNAIKFEKFIFRHAAPRRGASGGGSPTAPASSTPSKTRPEPTARRPRRRP